MLKEFAESNGFDGAFLTSSKSGYNINKSISFLIKVIIKRIENMPTEGKEVFEEKSDSIVLYPDKTIINKKFYESLYSIDQILFNDLEGDLIGICMYKEDDKIGYEWQENIVKLKEKYKFLNWIEDKKNLLIF